MIDPEKQSRTVSAPLAAGRYWIGDPCYAFRDSGTSGIDPWGEWLEDAWRDTDPNRVTILDGAARGARVVASRTAYGDGFYEASDGNAYAVDAGLLGAVHEKHWMVDARKAAECGMALTEFPEPFTVEFYPETGTVRIGHVTIETGDADEEEEPCPHCGGEDCEGECLEGDTHSDADPGL